MSVSQSTYGLRVVATIFMLSFGVYLLLATLTYTPFDPGWSRLSSETLHVTNASGVAGAWLADLLFSLFGWAALLLPFFVLLEAVHLWWSRSYLTRPFRYAAQFFLMVLGSGILYLLWQMPSDGLANASGGIVGFELAERLSGVLTHYGALALLMLLSLLLLTLIFKIKWRHTIRTINRVPTFLHDMFYRDLAQEHGVLEVQPISQLKSKHGLNHSQPAPEPHTSHNSVTAQIETDKASTVTLGQQPLPTDTQLPLEKTQQDAHLTPLPTQSVVEDEQVYRITEHEHDIALDTSSATLTTAPVSKLTDLQPNVPVTNEQQQIEQLIAEADRHLLKTEPVITSTQTEAETSLLDWSDDRIFDELLAAVPQEPAVTNQSIATSLTASAYPSADSTTPESVLAREERHLSTPHIQQAAEEPRIVEPQLGVETEHQDVVSTQNPVLESALTTSNGIKIVLPEPTESFDQAQNIHDARAALQSAESIKTNPVIHSARDSDEDSYDADFDADFDTDLEAGLDIDLDAPLTDSTGRVMSRAMQVVEQRKLLSPLPPLELLDTVDPNKKVHFSADELTRLSQLLEIKLQDFNVKAKVVEAQPGPVVTRFELDLAPGVKASKVTGISSDLARSMSMASVRVVEVIPGKPYIGIEVPNSSREMVRLIELLQTPAYRDPNGLISMAMGKDIAGKPIITDLAKAPHMLVAGTTGSGKSVAVNAMILSMLLKYTPKELRLILIDPKQLELANYEDIPHLLTPVVTDMKDAVNALNWCVNEMERRYKLMAFMKIRKINDYNRKVEEALERGDDLIDPTWKPNDSATQDRAPRLQPLPMIVIVADEFADMIMQVGKKAEEMITRLAQKSRAAGIHLLLATQRPSVDVITGLIKANIPTRVALRVNSRIDSRTILDAGGAEDLLGHGDMLFLGPGKIEPERAHGAFISDDEVNRICDAWRERGSPNYVDEILTPFDEDGAANAFESSEGSDDRDAMYDQCVAFVLETRKVSVSSLQRKFSLGYNRAARIVDQMEESGIVSAMGANGKRDILV